MKTLLIIFVFFLLFSTLVLSTTLDVGVSEDVSIKIINENLNISNNVVKFSTEFYNIGSVGYKGRARLFVYNGTNLISDGWSEEKSLMPGEKKTFDIYWYAKYSGNYEYVLRMYYGNEILENDKKELKINETHKPEDIFEITNYRTYDDHIIFDLKSKEDARDIVIIPYRYVTGWIFEQKAIPNMEKDSVKAVSLNYIPLIWAPANLTLAVASDNGKYYSESNIRMDKLSGLIGLIYSIYDRLRRPI